MIKIENPMTAEEKRAKNAARMRASRAAKKGEAVQAGVTQSPLDKAAEAIADSVELKSAAKAAKRTEVKSPKAKTAKPKADKAARAPRAPKAAKESTPKAGGRVEAALALLTRAKGVTNAELCEAFGWLPHTTRAFLSATIAKKLGYKLTAEKDDKRGTIYRVAA